MTEDGHIADSAALPDNYVEGHPITVSAESFLDTIQARSQTGTQHSDVDFRDAQNSGRHLEAHPITTTPASVISSGGFGRDQSDSLQAHPINQSGGSVMDSGSVQGHTIMHSPASVTSTRTARSSRFEPSARNIQSHAPASSPASTTQPGGSIVGSGTPESLQGYPLTYSGSSITSTRGAEQIGMDQSARQLTHEPAAPHQVQRQHPPSDHAMRESNETVLLQQSQNLAGSAAQSLHLVELELRRNLEVFMEEHPGQEIRYHTVQLPEASQQTQDILPGESWSIVTHHNIRWWYLECN